MFSLPETPVLIALASLFGGIILIWQFAERKSSGDQPTDLQLRMGTWVKLCWLILAIFFLKTGWAVALIAFISFIAFKEYITAVPTRAVDRTTLAWAYLAIPVQYYFIGGDQFGFFLIWVPLYVMLLVSARMVAVGQTRNFIFAVGTLHWGLMMTVYAIGHAAYLLVLPYHAPDPGLSPDGRGLLLGLLVLTSGNDAAAYVWGKTFGRRKIAPAVSPNKTFEGFAGAAITIGIASALLLPVLTPAGHIEALFLGLIIALFGFLGDLVMSAVKRDLGVKDLSRLLPGHGGALDRLDSLMFTAPIYFHWFKFFHYS